MFVGLAAILYISLFHATSLDMVRASGAGITFPGGPIAR